jgi:hypothetical protein
MKLKIIAGFGAGKRSADIGHEYGTIPTTVRAIVAANN